MNKLHYLYIFFTLLLTSPGISSQDIIFYEFDFPPFLITSGEFAEHGILNYFKKVFLAEFSDYDLTVHQSNDMKIWSELNKKPNVIISAGLKTSERLQQGIYSIPYLLLLPNGIIIDRSNYDNIKPYLNEIGEVKLEALITESRLKGGISLEQVYGGIIDETLTKHRYNKNIYPDYFKSFEDKIYTVSNRELDYVFGFPVEAEFFMKKHPETGGEIMNLAIEGMTEFSLVYMIVSKSELGQTMIEEINTFINKTIRQKEFHEKYEYWLDEENKIRYRRYIKEVFNIVY